MAAVIVVDNGFRPMKGERVRVIGNCHPKLVNKIVDVVDVYEDGATLGYEDEGEYVTTAGMHGGLEPLYFTL